MRGVSEIESLISVELKSGSLVGQENHSAIFLPAGSSPTLSNVFLVSKWSLRFVKEESMTVSDDSVVLPISCIWDSPIETLVHLKLLFSLCLQMGTAPSSEFQNSLQNCPQFQPAVKLMLSLFGGWPDAAFSLGFPWQLVSPQLARWSDLHSVQILLCHKLSRKAFEHLPLSSEFSFETASFVAARLDPIAECTLAEYLQRNVIDLGLGVPIGGVAVSILAEHFEKKAAIRRFQEVPETFLDVAMCNQTTRRMIFEFIQQAPSVGLLLFLRYVHAEWPIGQKRLLVVSVPDQGLLSVGVDDGILAIGRFPSPKEFRTDLLMQIEKVLLDTAVC
jgi:hypothetical protein